jgi:hypothetical protein
MGFVCGSLFLGGWFSKDENTVIGKLVALLLPGQELFAVSIDRNDS